MDPANIPPPEDDLVDALLRVLAWMMIIVGGVAAVVVTVGL